MFRDMQSRNLVIYVGGFELPDKNAASHRVISNGKIYRELGYEVIFIGVSKDVSKQNWEKDFFEFEGFKCVNRPYPKSFNEWVKFLSSIDFLKIVDIRRVVQVVAYNFPSIALFKLKQFSKKNRIELIGDCTEWYEPQGNLLFKLIKGLDVYYRMRILHPKLSGLIVISDYLEEFYKKDAVPIVNLPPLVDMTMEKWNISPSTDLNSTFRLIYAGSAGTGKKDRIDVLINLFANISNSVNRSIELHLVGLTLSDFERDFNFKLSKNQLKNIVFHGRISHVETLQLVSSADFQFFIRERNLTNLAGFPTKFVESISCGTPVITNDSGTLKKYLRNVNYGVFIHDFDELSISKALLFSMGKSKLEVRSMKSACKESKEFDYVNYVDSFNVFLNKILPI